MSELYTSTLKYFRLAVSEFLPRLRELQKETQDKKTKEELEDLVEAYDDIASKIDKHNLNLDDPNRYYDGEPDEIEIDIPNGMVVNLARLSHRLLLVWKEKLGRLKKKEYLTDKNQDELYKLEHLISPLEALLKEKSYVLGKYTEQGPLEFPGEPPKKEDKFVSGLSSLLDEIRLCYSLGDQELLERKKLEDLETRLRTDLGQIITGLTDEVVKLKYQKLNSGWSTTLKSGLHNRKTAEERLDHWEAFIEETIENISGSKPHDEIYFSEGRLFDAVKALREILKLAKTKIWIEDNFLHPDSVRIVEPYIAESNLGVRFLTRRNGNRNFSSFSVDIGKLKSQYQSLDIEARENDHCHDRYIIIDEKTIYHFGQSFHDLGRKASQINKVEELANKNKILDDFKNWWDTGNQI